MGRLRGLTAALLLDLTCLTSIHEDSSAKLGTRRHEKRHRNASSAGHEPPGGEDRAESEAQKENAASDLRVSHSLDEVKAHAAPNSKSEGEISSVASGGVSEALFPPAPQTPAEASRKKGHEAHVARGHESTAASTQSEIHAVQLSYLYLGAMKTLSALLSCSKYAELLLIPKVWTRHILVFVVALGIQPHPLLSVSISVLSANKSDLTSLYVRNGTPKPDVESTSSDILLGLLLAAGYIFSMFSSLFTASY